MALHAMIVLLAPLHGLHKGWVFGAVSGHSERLHGVEPEGSWMLQRVVFSPVVHGK
jgi:hypothetical protein